MCVWGWGGVGVCARVCVCVCVCVGVWVCACMLMCDNIKFYIIFMRMYIPVLQYGNHNLKAFYLLIVTVPFLFLPCVRKLKVK